MMTIKPKLGMGCWAIGGPFYAGEEPVGFANTNDPQSLATLEASYEAGVRLFDTAAVYGTGHSERLVGQALAGKTDVVISTKFGVAFDEATKQMIGEDVSPDTVMTQLDRSRKRLNRDVLDLVFLHINTLPIDQAMDLFDRLEEARSQGVVGAYGWSTDFPQRAQSMAGRPGYVAIQHAMNVFFDAPSIQAVAENHELVAFNRSPLAMGLLTGKFSNGKPLPANDVRQNTWDWMDYFKDGKVDPDFEARLAALRDLLTVEGRSLAQGALCWLWAKSPVNVPIPGARTPEQAVHNAQALAFGPLPQDVMDSIETILQRPPEGEPRER